MRTPTFATHYTSRTLHCILLIFVISFSSLGFYGQLAYAAILEKTEGEPMLSKTQEPPPNRAAKIDFPIHWVEFAHGISEITAAAVSPLLVVSVIGVNRYMRATESERGQLPFFCNPLLWGTGLVLLVVCFLKDVLGTALPSLFKKPLDLLELFENKLSALVASTLFVPVITWQMLQDFGQAAALSPLPSGVHLASVWPTAIPALDLHWLLVPVCFLSFFTVWMTAHIVSVLIAICPIGFVDALLKLFKNGVFGVLVITSALNPFLGAACSVCLILFAILVAGTAFRFTVFGTIFAFDALTFWSSPKHMTSGSVRAFTTERLEKVPARTLGRLVRTTDGSYAFTYRSWFVLPTRSVPLPEGTLVLHRDVLTVSLVVRAASGDERRLVEFPPRYRRQWEKLAELYVVSEVRDGHLAGGFMAAWGWVQQLFGVRIVPSKLQ